MAELTGVEDIGEVYLQKLSDAGLEGTGGGDRDQRQTDPGVREPR